MLVEEEGEEVGRVMGMILVVESFTEWRSGAAEDSMFAKANMFLQRPDPRSRAADARAR